MEGRGVMRKAAGGQYEGEFSDSRRHGAGVETFGPSNVRRKATLFFNIYCGRFTFSEVVFHPRFTCVTLL